MGPLARRLKALRNGAPDGDHLLDVIKGIMALKLGKVVIVGPGLIGGSVGLGLRQAGAADRIVGVGHRASSLQKAQEMGAIHEGTLALEEAVPGAEIVMLATRVGLIAEMAAKAAPLMPAGGILTDVGSTKGRVTEQIEAMLAETDVGFVGAHPIAGSERRGIGAAQADLFQNALCIVTRTPNTDPNRLAKVTALWETLGAKVSVMTPEQHDKTLAQISHVVHLAAVALVNSADEAALAHAARGFLDTTRVASGDPALWRDICLSNDNQLAAALRAMTGALDEFARALERGDADALLDLLDRAKRRRDGLLNDKKP